MTANITSDQVVEAAGELDSSGFTRLELAEKLGVKPMDLQDAVKEARQAGRLEKTGSNEDGKGLFRVAS